MSEKFTFEQGIRKRTTVLGDEEPPGTIARMMDRPRHEVLSCPGFPGDQDGRIGPGNLVREIEDLLHRGAVAQDTVEGETPFDLLAQVSVLGLEAMVGRFEVAGELFVSPPEFIGFEGALHIHAEFFRLPGLGDVAIDVPLVDPANQGREIGVAGEHHPHDRRVAFQDRFQEFDARHRRHDLVGDHERNVFAIENLQALDSRLRGVHAILGIESQLDGFQDPSLVIDDKDPVTLGVAFGTRTLDAAKGVRTHAWSRECAQKEVREKIGGYPRRPSVRRIGRDRENRGEPLGTGPPRCSRTQRRLALAAFLGSAPFAAGRRAGFFASELRAFGLRRARHRARHLGAGNVPVLVDEVEVPLFPLDADFRHDLGLGLPDLRPSGLSRPEHGSFPSEDVSKTPGRRAPTRKEDRQ